MDVVVTSLSLSGMSFRSIRAVIDSSKLKLDQIKARFILFLYLNLNFMFFGIMSAILLLRYLRERAEYVVIENICISYTV